MPSGGGRNKRSYLDDECWCRPILGGISAFGIAVDLKLKVVTDPISTPPKVSPARLS
jgi:hypothetical protein